MILNSPPTSYWKMCTSMEYWQTMMNKYKTQRPMKKILLFAFFLLGIAAAFAQPSPVGWASLNGGTIGGFGGETVIITNRAQFLANVLGDEPRILFIQDTLELNLYERVKVYSNKTIFGLTENAMIRYGGLEIVGDNVIVQNLVIGDFYDGDWSGTTNSTDCLTLYGENIWIDHCWLYAGADGLLDIRSGNGSIADYVTISYTRFGDHNKVSLIGSSDNSTQDRDHLRVTFHHCWFDGTYGNQLNQRMPRVRFGDVHVFNNYYEGSTSYCVAARIESDVVVENTYFRDAAGPHEINDLGVGLENPDLVAINNIYELCSGSQTTSGDAWVPSDFYDYDPTPTWDVPALVMNEAGPFNPTSNQGPIAVNDTIDFSNMSGGLNLFVTDNDIDPDGGDLRIAQLASTPAGIGFIKENKIIYAPPANGSGIDTVAYLVVDTQGGVDTGLVLIFYEGLTATDDLSRSSGIRVYPNPATDSTTLELPDGTASSATIELYNEQGVLVRGAERATRYGDDRIVLDTAGLEAGIYLITVEINGQLHTEKLIVVN